MKYIGNVQAEANAEVYAVASGAIGTDITCIVNSDGTVSVVSATGATISPAVNWTTDNVSHNDSAFDAANDLIVIAYQVQGSETYYGHAVAATISGTTLTFGTPVVFNSSATYDLSISFDINANKFVIAFRDIAVSPQKGTAIVATVAMGDRSITFGNKFVFSGAAYTVNIDILYDPTEEAHFIKYDRGGGKLYGIVATVSGTNLSFGTEVVATGDPYADLHRWGTAHITGTSKFFSTWSGNGDGIHVCVATVSGTSVSWGADQSITGSPAYSFPTPVYDSTLSKMVTFYKNGNVSGVLAGFAVISTISGTTVTSGSPITFESETCSRIYSATFDPVNNKILLIYSTLATNYQHYYRIISISGAGNDELTIGARVEYSDSGEYLFTRSSFDSNNVQMVVSFNEDETNGTTRIVKTAGTTLTSENFIGVSNAAYATGQTATIQAGGAVNTGQSSLTIGQQYFVQTNGTLGLTAATPSVIAGTAVSATDIIVKG